MFPPSSTVPHVQVENSGVYFFRAPLHVTAVLNQEILVVFTVPTIRGCGLVYIDSEMPQRIVEGMLENIFQKLSQDLKIKSDHTQVKIFGQSFRKQRSLSIVRDWLQSKNLSVVAMDVGKRVTRNLIIDCDTGRVGVGYAESYPNEEPPFLSLGTARLRSSMASMSVEVLVLSTNRVTRTLAKQAIDAIAGHRANCPKNPMQENIHIPS
jgi:hypothetical protein